MPATTTAPAAVKVGDFFSCSWGYDQTNIDFYKVVGITASGKSVKVQEWSQKSISDDGGPYTTVVPGDSPATYVDWSAVDRDADYWTQQEQKVTRDKPVMTKRLRGTYITINDYSSASLWDGKPEYQTGSGWGH